MVSLIAPFRIPSGNQSRQDVQSKLNVERAGAILSVPPNPGDDGGLILSIDGGGTYCVAFGGAARGSESSDSGQLWKTSNPVAQGCLSP